jgi:hypothetical protein
MNSSLRPAVFASLLCGCLLSACAPQNPASSTTAATNDTTTTPAESTGPTDDPCALTTDAEVRKAFPDAKSGVRDHSLDKYEIATCTWDSSTNTFVVQIFKAKGSAHDEVRSRMSGSLDPIKPGAGANIKYDPIAGLGDEATVVAEKADEPQGIFADTAVLAIRRGDRMAVLFSRSLIEDRATTVKALEALGRSAAPRL